MKKVLSTPKSPKLFMGILATPIGTHIAAALAETCSTAPNQAILNTKYSRPLTTQEWFTLFFRMPLNLGSRMLNNSPGNATSCFISTYTNNSLGEKFRKMQEDGTLPNTINPHLMSTGLTSFLSAGIMNSSRNFTMCRHFKIPFSIPRAFPGFPMTFGREIFYLGVISNAIHNDNQTALGRYATNFIGGIASHPMDQFSRFQASKTLDQNSNSFKLVLSELKKSPKTVIQGSGNRGLMFILSAEFYRAIYNYFSSPRTG